MDKIIYPPHPHFPSPDAHAREKMLGKFQYQILAGGAIKILGGWAQQNLVKVHIPQLALVEAAPKDCNIVFHRAGVKQLQSLFAAWERAGLIHLVKTWAGTFAPRMIRGSHTNLSNHAYGSAFDINAAWNGLGRQPATGDGTVLPLVALANAHGFFWGGHYNNRLDGMHFELAVVGMFPKTLIASAAASGGATINQKTEVYPGNVAQKINSISAAPVAAGQKEAEPVGAFQQTAEPADKVKTESAENSGEPQGNGEQSGNSNAVPVPQAEPAKDTKPEESFLEQAQEKATWLSGKIMAIPAAVLTFLGGIWAWFVALPPVVIISFFGSSTLIISSYVSWFMWLKNKREARAAAKEADDNKLKLQREQQAHELTLYQMRSVAEKDLTPVRVVPKPLENSDS